MHSFLQNRFKIFRFISLKIYYLIFKYISNIFSKIFTKILNIGTAIVSSIDNFSDNIEARQRWLELQHQRLDKLEQLEKIKNTTFDPFKPSLKDMAKILNSNIKPQQNINNNSNKNIIFVANYQSLRANCYHKIRLYHYATKNNRTQGRAENVAGLL